MAAAMPTTSYIFSKHAFQRAKNINGNAKMLSLDFNYRLKCRSTNINSNVSRQTMPSTHLVFDQININSMKLAGSNMTSTIGEDFSMEAQPIIGNESANTEPILRTIEEDLSMEAQPIIGNGSADTEPNLRRIARLLDESTKLVLLIAAVSVLVWRYDSPEVLWAFTGCVLNGGSSKPLKRLLKQPRPASATGLKTDPGMPSSHAQNLGYFATYAIFILIGCKGVNTFTVGVASAIIAWASSMAWLRVSEGFHNHLQVIAGIFIGSISAIAWFWIWTSMVLSMLASICPIWLFSFSQIAISTFGVSFFHF